MAYEITRSKMSSLAAAFIMAIIPAHLMRSVAGDFDNESIAVAAIFFYFLPVTAVLADPQLLAACLCCGCELHLRGCGLGCVHVCAEHD